MNIFVSREGQTFGPYSKEQASQFLETGQLLATDFALYEGESEWKTLDALLNLSVPKPASTVIPVQTSQKSRISLDKSLKKKSVVGKQRSKVKMNQGQSTVVVQKKGIGSRIFSTFLVFTITCIVVCGGVAGLYFAMPTKVGPIMNKFGIVKLKPLKNEETAVSVGKQPSTDPDEITLNDEDWQRLRSTNVILLSTDKGDGFRVISPPEKELGLNDDDLEALIPISSKILSLDLTHAEISDRGISVLSRFENLQRLYLEGNKGVTVQGITQLKSLKNLTYLNLVRIELDEKLVDLLISMETLREIYLYETGLNEDAISRLVEERPKVFVNGG